MKSVRVLDWKCVEPVIAFDPYDLTKQENLAFGIEGKVVRITVQLYQRKIIHGSIFH